MLTAASRGEMDGAQILAMTRDSPPYAWVVVTSAVDDQAPGKPFGEHDCICPTCIHNTCRSARCSDSCNNCTCADCSCSTCSNTA